METPQAQNIWWIITTIIISFFLDAMPLPDFMSLGRPEWVFLVVFYWAVMLPYRVGVGVGFTVGLLLDVLDGTLMGMQAFTLALTSYLGLILSDRLRIYPLIQQTLLVSLVFGLHLVLSHWIKGMVGVVSQGYMYLLPAATSAVIWPFVFLIMNEFQRRFRVQ